MSLNEWICDKVDYRSFKIEKVLYQSLCMFQLIEYTEFDWKMCIHQSKLFNILLPSDQRQKIASNRFINRTKLFQNWTFFSAIFFFPLVFYSCRRNSLSSNIHLWKFYFVTKNTFKQFDVRYWRELHLMNEKYFSMFTLKTWPHSILIRFELISRV